MAPGEDHDIMVRRKKNLSLHIIICLIAFHYCAPLLLTCPLPLLPGTPASIADLNLFLHYHDDDDDDDDDAEEVAASYAQ